MPELTINVPSYIGESYMDWDSCEWVQGITWNDIEMYLAWAEMMGEKADSILLSIGACDGGSTLEGFNIYNKLRALGLPIRTHITGYAASMGVPVALASDELPEMDYLAQLMLHRASFSSGVNAGTSEELRGQADRLDNTNQLLFDLLTARTGQPADVVNGWLSPKETWLTATQAKTVGLCGKVNPIPVGTTATEADSLITARRNRTSQAVARADKRAAITATVKAAVPAAPLLMPDVKKPIGQAVKPTPRPVAPAAKAKAPAARKTLFQQLKELLSSGEEESDETEAVAADPQSTELDNGAFLYHDGTLAVDSAVFNDEALTEATADGVYDTADAQAVTVAAGIVTSLDPVSTGTATTDTTATASLEKRFSVLEASLKAEQAKAAALKLENEQLRKQKPPLPTARAARANADAPDPKAAAPVVGKAAAHHAGL